MLFRSVSQSRYTGGASQGASIGSAIPGLGTAVGGIIGGGLGLLGGLFGGRSSTKNQEGLMEKAWEPSSRNGRIEDFDMQSI